MSKFELILAAMIFVAAGLVLTQAAWDAEPTVLSMSTPEPEHCGMSDRGEPSDCLTPTPTPTPCADDEERLEDGTCQQVLPPEEFPPKVIVTPFPTPTPFSCQEDEPCWDCETMGNLVCGPVSLPDTGGSPP